MIDHCLLYTDKAGFADWQNIVKKSNGRNGFWRKYARKKMRRVANQLLNGIRPNLKLGEYDELA